MIDTLITNREAIIAATLDYALSGYEGDATRISRALHPQLAKRAPLPDANGAVVLHEMSKDELVELVAGGTLQQPPDHRQADINIVEIYGDAAIVRLEMNDWIDFLQLIKLDGQWSIINVLWHLK